MSDNTILLGIIVILNGIYIGQNYNQNRKLNKWIEKMEKFIEDLIIIKTEHKLNHSEGHESRKLK